MCLMIRALATGDVYRKDWSTLVGKELLVALLLGVTMTAAIALVASFRAPEIIAVVALTMFCIVGMSLPFIFTRFGADPATASAPLITSIADISGVLIYLSIPTWGCEAEAKNDFPGSLHLGLANFLRA